jgi:DNA polymerase (family 10)
MSLNAALAQRLEDIARMMDLLGEDSFRTIAHSRAARAIDALSDDIATLASDKKKLLEIEGIGPKIADKIIEFVKTGTIKEHEEMRAKVPAGLLEMMTIPGLGPKTVRAIWQTLDVKDMAGLKKAIDDGSMLTVPRMGQKAIDKIKASMTLAEKGSDRLAMGLALPIAQRLVATMKKVKGVKEAAYAGSLRRGRETVGDLDILVATTDPAAATKAFTTQPGVVQIIAAGEAKSSIRLAVKEDLDRFEAEGKKGDAYNGPSIQADLRIIPPDSWGAGMMYFTGSKDHNVRLRGQALDQGYTLNEFGLFPEIDDPTPPQHRGAKPVASKTEEEIYKKLGHPYIPPEIREDRGELNLKTTPRLIEIADIKAELHAHTRASDGAMTIEELAAQAKARGFHTIAVTDHSKGSVQANGLSVDRLLAHIEAIRKASEKVKGITMLAGSEVDILADGRLDYDDAILKQLDIVVASPHAALTQEPEVATKRLITAIKNKYVHILGHATGRMVNRRPGLDPDIQELAAAAKEHHVALEINSHWHRLDLRDIHVKAAVDAGCLISINCDTHSPEDLDNLQFGILTARRGWLTPDLCINTWTAKKLHGWLKEKR